MEMTNHEKKKKKTERANGLSKFYSVLSKNTPFTYVEAFKTLRTNLEFVSSSNNVRSILVTSAVPEESKSTTAINLALTFAKGGYSVVLVECDMRKPTLRRYLKLEKRAKGLSSILSVNMSLEECIVPVEEIGIHVIYAGAVPPNPSELLNSEKMREVIEQLKRQYDYVILDTPPVTVVTDAAVVGRMVDGALLVIRSKYASTNTIRLAKQRLEAVNVKILGAVLTRFNVKQSGWRSGYNYEGYEYGYGQSRNVK